MTSIDLLKTLGLWYGIGFLFTLIFLSIFGKKLGYDYDNRNDEYDDWESNSHAYSVFSLIWPVFMFFNLMWGLWIVLTSVTSFILNFKKHLLSLFKFIKHKFSDEEEYEDNIIVEQHGRNIEYKRKPFKFGR